MIVLNFALNKFLPFVLIACLGFYGMGFDRFEPYLIIALSLFVGDFNFKAGYAVAFCEKNNIDVDIHD
jgi:hypothetical protein